MDIRAAHAKYAATVKAHGIDSWQANRARREYTHAQSATDPTYAFAHALLHCRTTGQSDTRNFILAERIARFLHNHITETAA